MKLLILTSEVSTRNGWGRYSGDLVAALQKEGIESTIVASKKGEFSSLVRPLLPEPLEYPHITLFAWWYAWRMRALARECDAIHCFVETYAPIAEALSQLSGKPYLVTVHGTYGLLGYTLPFLLKRAHKSALKHARHIVAVSDYTKRRMEEKGLGNITAIHNGIDSFAFEGARPSFKEREPLIVSVGALKRRKGQHVSVAAFAEVLSKVPGARYCIVADLGDREYLAKIKKAAEEYGVLDKIIFKDIIPQDELLALYRKARAFILTPLSEGPHFEGFGLVYLEANACGLPVVGSKDSGGEDAIQDKKTGFLVPQNDTKAASEALAVLLLDEAIWNSMSKEGIAWALSHDWSLIAPHYAKLYRLL